jgi:hAT family C-terminal dimerisation region
MNHGPKTLKARPSERKESKKKDKPPESVFDKIHGELVGLKLGTADDFQSFISAPQEELHGLAPVQWWCLDGQRSRYPKLQQMALDFLSVPPMSDAPERTFSGGRRTISWTRARLKPENVEMVETMANWVVNGLIPPDTGMKELLEEFAEIESESDVDSSDNEDEF